MTQHHPSTPLLLDYAAGNVSVAQSICISTHLHFCAHCQQQTMRLDQVGGELLDTLPGDTVDGDLFAQLMQRIDCSAPIRHAVSHLPNRLPRVLQKLIPQGFDKLSWQRISRSLEVYRLTIGNGDAELALHRIYPGGKVVEHSHRGEELTVVLQGGFFDQHGSYELGDFIRNDENCTHRPAATGDEMCICLSGLSAPIRFTQPWMRVLNPFMRLRPS